MTRPPKGRFVKAWETQVPVSRTKGAFEELIRRYGATGFTVSEDYAAGRVLVAFQIGGPDGEPQEIALPVDYANVERRLRDMPEFVRRLRAREFGERQATWAREQSARVAWRHLLLWADAFSVCRRCWPAQHPGSVLRAHDGCRPWWRAADRG